MIALFGPTGLSYPGGAVVSSVPVAVYEAGTDSLAQLWSDDGGTVPKTNPVVTDPYGNLYFYVEEGTYDLLVNNRRVTVAVDYPEVDVTNLALEDVENQIEADVLAALEPPINLAVLYSNARSGGNLT